MPKAKNIAIVNLRSSLVCDARSQRDIGQARSEQQLKDRHDCQ